MFLDSQELVLSTALPDETIIPQIYESIVSWRTNAIVYSFFFVVLRSDIDILDQEPGFFPGLTSTLSLSENKSPLSVLILDTIASSNVGTVFEVIVIPGRCSKRSSIVAAYSIGLLRVPTRLVPTSYCEMKLPRARLGEITVEMETQDWDVIRVKKGGEFVATFPPEHTVPLSHRWDYGAGAVVEL